MNFTVDLDTLTRNREELAVYSDTESPMITRVVFSESVVCTLPALSLRWEQYL